MTEQYKESPIRKVLRSEYAWWITMFSMAFGVIKFVVLPINSMQIQITQIQSQLVSEQQKYLAIIEQLKTISDQGIKTATKLDEHLRK